jgi:hypothetical protein
MTSNTELHVNVQCHLAPVAQACNPSYSGGSLKTSKKENSKPLQKRTGGVAQVVECLPSKCETQVPLKKKSTVS